MKTEELVTEGPYKNRIRLLGKPKYFNRIRWAFNDGMKDLNQIQHLLYLEKRAIISCRTDLNHNQKHKRFNQIKRQLKETVRFFKEHETDPRTT